MKTLVSKRNEEIKIYTDEVSEKLQLQLEGLANSPIGEGANIRIMPDCHVGKGCVIGTTMRVKDKVCPNVVGVDLSCGVSLFKYRTDLGYDLEELDRVIRTNIPHGTQVHKTGVHCEELSEMYCWEHLSENVKDRAYKALGTLGGGNHFIEAYEGGLLSIHTGSRGIGKEVATYYQKKAEEDYKRKDRKLDLSKVAPKERAKYIEEQKSKKEEISKDLLYLEGEELEKYLHDIEIMDVYARRNRREIAEIIAYHVGGAGLILSLEEVVNSTHNYIEKETNILRKGATSAKKGEKVLIPLNMRDGMLLCEGKGNEDWNNSAPHGAGRLYGRKEAKEKLDMKEFEESMKGVYTTSVSEATLDEAPLAYKDAEEIKRHIEPTVKIIKLLKPIYNFKSN